MGTSIEDRLYLKEIQEAADWKLGKGEFDARRIYHTVKKHYKMMFEGYDKEGMSYQQGMKKMNDYACCQVYEALESRLDYHKKHGELKNER